MKKMLWILLPALLLTGCANLDLSRLSGTLANATASLTGGDSSGDSGLAKTLTTARHALVGTSAAEEKEIGEQSAALLLGSVKPLANKRVQQYVNLVGRWVAAQSSRPDIDWHFAVLNDPDINAFAAPDGYVFITSGLFKKLDSEAELAGVLGHEMVHVTHKHYLKAIQHEAQLSLLGMAAKSAMKDQQHTQELAAIAKGARTVYSRGLDKGDEYEADRIGVVLAARAGYDAYGLPAVLQMLDQLNPQSSGLALLLKTHPKASDRLARLTPAMQGRLDQLPSAVEGESRFLRYRAMVK